MNTETNYAAAFYSETDNDTAVLEKNVIDYPSSSVARFLLLYHYKKNNNPRFEEFAKQTGMYLNNPLWAQYQLSGTEEHNGFENEINIANEELPKAVNEGKSENLILDANPAGAEALAPEISNGESNETIDLEIAPVENNDDSSSEIKEIPLEQKHTNEFPAAVNEQINENFILGVEPAKESKDEDFENPIKETTSAEEEVSPVNTTSTDTNKDIFSENLAGIDTIEESFPEKPTDSDEKLKEVNGINPETEVQEIAGEESEDPEVSFEPLHTVDYFASQGIKIPEEALENDALGKQVKSFTAWLKTMKKLHPGQLPEQNDVIEKIIQASSEVSNQSANILTEAMAEVLVKQGKREKAIEMYQKLSLLNPSKSAYFAAKIESLKTT